MWAAWFLPTAATLQGWLFTLCLYKCFWNSVVCLCACCATPHKFCYCHPQPSAPTSQHHMFWQYNSVQHAYVNRQILSLLIQIFVVSQVPAYILVPTRCSVVLSGKTHHLINIHMYLYSITSLICLFLTYTKNIKNIVFTGLLVRPNK